MRSNRSNSSCGCLVLHLSTQDLKLTETQHTTMSRERISSTTKSDEIAKLHSNPTLAYGGLSPSSSLAKKKVQPPISDGSSSAPTIHSEQAVPLNLQQRCQGREQSSSSRSDRPPCDVNIGNNSKQSPLEGIPLDDVENDTMDVATATAVADETNPERKESSSDRNLGVGSNPGGDVDNNNAGLSNACNDADSSSTDSCQHPSACLPQHEKELEPHIAFEVARIAQRNKAVLFSRLAETAPRGCLSLLNLSHRFLGVEDAKLLKQAIIANPKLSVLKLSYNNLGDEGGSIIASALLQNGCHHSNLSVLDLGFNSIGDIGCESLASHGLAGNYALHTLYLSGNQIGEKGALSLAGAILHGTGLSTLHLSANRIGSMGMKAIAGAVTKIDSRVAAASGTMNTTEENSQVRTIEELHLGSTFIGADGFIAIPGLLLSNNSLRTLCVPGNRIGDQGMLLLSQALSQNKLVPLESLELSFNQITCLGVECLMNSVWGSKSLRELKLDNNKIQDRGAQLCAVALTSIDLEVLDLGFNRISTVGLKALMKNISESTSLALLGLSGICFDQNMSKAVSFALAYNTSLRALYMDNCSAGYSAQRHIVAGIVSNRRVSLRKLTGFSLGPIAVTLGLPKLPEEWSNNQVLGFIKLMWQQWELKAGRGTTGPEKDVARGPAPPAAVAAAAKIAFTTLGGDLGKLFSTEAHEKPIAEGSPVDPASSALIERTDSGTMLVPTFSASSDEEICEFTDGRVKTPGMEEGLSSSSIPPFTGLFENPERRNLNLQWLRVHFRSLSDIGRMPFNNADLWQLHQYYFSPPFYPTDDGNTIEEPEKSLIGSAELDHADGVKSMDESAASPTISTTAAQAPPLGRTVSFQALGSAFACSGNKRRSDDETMEENDEPAAKRVKNLKPRIAYYPRLMAKIQSLGSIPMDQTLSLLRQLKYAENILFAKINPYAEFDQVADDKPNHSDIEMILLDLL